MRQDDLKRPMGDTGIGWDNSPAESFWLALKHERYYRHTFAAKAELVAADDPRSLALPSWDDLVRLALNLVNRSADRYAGWGDVVTFAASTAARIGEVSGIRKGDIDCDTWIWTVRRQTTTGPGGLIDKGTKGTSSGGSDHRGNPADGGPPRGPGGEARLALVHRSSWWPDQYGGAQGRDTLGRGGDVTRLRAPAAARLATHGPNLARRCGGSGPRPSKIAGHGSLTTTQRYLHPDRRSIEEAGTALSAHLSVKRSTNGPHLRAV